MKDYLVHWLRTTSEKTVVPVLVLVLGGLTYFFVDVFHLPKSRIPFLAVGAAGGLAYFWWILYPPMRERYERERQEYERQVREYEQQRQDQETVGHDRRTRRPKRRPRYRSHP